MDRNGVRMTRLPGRGRQLLLAGAATLVVACAPVVQVHGFAPTPEEIAQITPGRTDRSGVEQLVGLPSSTGVMEDSAWYYVLTETTQYTYRAPEVSDRRVVAIAFNDAGTVTAVNQYGLEDGRVIDLQSRITLTEGAELTVIQQILSSFGNVNPANFLPQGS